LVRQQFGENGVMPYLQATQQVGLRERRMFVEQCFSNLEAEFAVKWERAPRESDL
jgi:hypothetical protein